MEEFFKPHIEKDPDREDEARKYSSCNVEIVEGEIKENADRMIDRSISSWSSPFDSPHLVFQNNRMKEWFTFYWVKTRKEPLLSLESEILEDYLWNTVDAEGKEKRLGRDRLTLHLISIIPEYIRGKDNPLSRYLGESTAIDYDQKLYDVSKTLSSLFLKYGNKKPGWNRDDSLWEAELYNTYVSPGVSTGSFRAITLQELWEKNKDRDISSPANTFIFASECLEPLQKEIVEKIAKGNITIFLPKEKELQLDKISVSSSQSKLREVEVLHSQICSLLEEGNAFEDILVVAPDITKYRNEIERVFCGGGKGTGFPHVSFSVADYTSRSSSVASFLEEIYEVMDRGEINRAEFFSALRNPLVEKKLNISSSTVDTWLRWVVDMNIFRDTEDGREDWAEGEERLLVSLITDEEFERGGKSILPYSSISSTDPDVLLPFLSSLDILRTLSHLGLRGDADEAFVETLISSLAFFLDARLSDDDPLSDEKFVYGEVVRFLRLVERAVENGSVMTRRSMFSALLDKARNAKGKRGTLFSHGITFMNFNPSLIVPVKYTFFLGLDSKSFPGSYRRSVLDISSDEEDLPLPERNRKGFSLLVGATEEKVFVSFTAKDLQKDEDYYLSSVLSSFDRGRIKQYGLDEDRSWNEIYTLRGKRNRENLALLFGNGEKEGRAFSFSLPERKEFSLSSVCTFLSNPMEAAVNEIFGFSDDISDKENRETEDIEMDPALKARIENELLDIFPTGKLSERINDDSFFASICGLRSRILMDRTRTKTKEKISGHLNNICSSCPIERKTKDWKVAAESLNYVLDFRCPPVLDRIFSSNRKLNQTNFVSAAKEENTFLNATQAKNYFKENKGTIEKVFGEALLHPCSGCPLKREKIDLTLGGYRISGESCLYTEENRNIYVFDRSSSIPRAFVSSLAIVATKGGEWNISLGEDTNYSLSGEEAGKRLIAIVASMNGRVEPYWCFPLDKSALAKEDFLSFVAFLGDETNGPWKYFRKGKLFDRENDLGLSAENYNEEKEKYLSLMFNGEDALLREIKDKFITEKNETKEEAEV
ncbi:MAG: exodeoxyribonuclease V subunit gamma [Candidatus Ornithospirochaeta sp.]